MEHRVVIESDTEDRVISIKQKGRRVIVTTERPGIASAIARNLVSAFEQVDDDRRIGFELE